MLHACRSSSPAQPSGETLPHTLPSQNLDWLQRQLTSSPFDRSFTAGSITDDDLYELPQGARPGRLEPSIDAEGIPEPQAAARADEDVDNCAVVKVWSEGSAAAADTSEWHHYADDQMQASMVRNMQSGSRQHTPLQSPRNQVTFSETVSHAHVDSSHAASGLVRPKQNSLAIPVAPTGAVQTQAWGETVSTSGRMYSSFAASWLQGTGSSNLINQDDSIQSFGMQAEASYRSQHLPATSSNASLQSLQEPHPPALPSTSQGLMSAPSGFKGRRGVSADPRLRRFKEAPATGEAHMLTSRRSFVCINWTWCKAS